MYNIYQGLRGKAQRQHDNARDGVLKYEGDIYTFTFNHYEGIYIVTDQSGVEITRYNTRKITVAKKWFREYMEG